MEDTPDHRDHDKSTKPVAALEPQPGKFIGVEIPRQRAIVEEYEASQNTPIVVIENPPSSLIINSSPESDNNAFEPVVDVPQVIGKHPREDDSEYELRSRKVSRAFIAQYQVLILDIYK